MEQIWFNLLLYALEKLVKTDIFEQIGEAVKEFFSERFDDMPGSEKFNAIVATFTPIVTGMGSVFLSMAIQALYTKYSPKVEGLK